MPLTIELDQSLYILSFGFALFIFLSVSGIITLCIFNPFRVTFYCYPKVFEKW